MIIKISYLIRRSRLAKKKKKRNCSHQNCDDIKYNPYVVCDATQMTLKVRITGMQINIRENRRGNQEWTIQRNWQHWVHKIQDQDK